MGTLLCHQITRVHPVVLFTHIFNKQCDHVVCRLIQCLENQLLNMSCMERGKDIHLERASGCQPSVPRPDTTTTATSWPK